MNRLSTETVNKMLEVLSLVRSDFQNTNFMWKWHHSTEQYALRFDVPPAYVEDWEFEDMLADEYLIPRGMWNSVLQGEVEDGIDIIEVEIIENVYKHKTK